MVLSEATNIDINRKKHKPDIAMLTVMLTVDETNRRDGRVERPMAIFCLYIIYLALEIGQRHLTLLLGPYLSSMLRCEGIKPDIFDINRDMPTTQARHLCLGSSGLTVSVGRTQLLFPCPYHISNRPKTRSQGSQCNVLALFHLLDDI